MDETSNILEEENRRNDSLPHTIDVPPSFRPDAKVWDIYLTLAEREARDKAALWNTSLDSLLIFAGLFAGVVSSFVIDARTDLQADSEQRSLTGLLQIAQSGSIQAALGIPITAYWISALWVISLCTTLFSAIVAVLAKAWLASYAMGSARRRDVEAYERYILDAEAGRWHAKVVVILPTLVQVASFLFVVGLTIQLHGDSSTIGRVLLSLAALGILVYIIMTFLPFLVPSSPINTPLSAILRAMFSVGSNTGAHPESKTQVDEILLDILYAKLILSEKPENVDEAISEIYESLAASKDNLKWLHALSKTDTPHVLLWRMRHYATSTMEDKAQQHETLQKQLSLFIAFVDTSESWNDGESGKLKGVLLSLLQFGYPLHRWNTLPKACRLVSFRLRGRLMALLSEDKPGWSLDFHRKEVEERPWEMVLQEVHSHHRIDIALASCWGIAKGGVHFRRVSTHILCMCLAKAMFAASESGDSCQWASDLTEGQRTAVSELALRYLFKLHCSAVSAWEETATVISANVLPATEVPPASGQSSAAVLESLVSSLSKPTHAPHRHHHHVIKMLQQVSSRNPSLILDGLRTQSIQIIASTTVDDKSAQGDGLDLLANLAGYPDTWKPLWIRVTLYISLRSGLLNPEDQACQPIIQFIGVLLARVEGGVDTNVQVRNLFISIIHDVIPSVVSLALDTSSPNQVRRLALQLSERVFERRDLDPRFEEVKRAVLDHVKATLEGADRNNQRTLIMLNDLKNLIEEGSSLGSERPAYTFPWSNNTQFIQEAVTPAFRSIVTVATFELDRTLSAGARAVLGLLAQDDRFNGNLNFEGITVLLQEAIIVKPSRASCIRLNAIMVTDIFSHQLKGTTSLFQILVETALMDDADDVRAASLALISKLCKGSLITDDMAQEVKHIIKAHISFISQEPRISIRESWVAFLSDICAHVYFPEAIPIIMEVSMANGHSSGFLSVVVKRLIHKDFALDWNYNLAVKESVPRDLNVVSSTGESGLSSRGAKSIELLITLLPHPDSELRDVANAELTKVVSSVREIVGTNLGPLSMHNSGVGQASMSSGRDSVMSPPLHRLLEKCDWNERLSWVGMLATLGLSFPRDFPHIASTILQTATCDPDSKVRSAALRALRLLADQSGITDRCLGEIMASLEGIASEKHWGVRLALVKLLPAVSGSPEFASGNLFKAAVAKLVSLAIDDRDPDIRSESVNSLSALLNDRDHAPLDEALTGPILGRFEAGIKDGDWKPRRAWVKFVAPHITSGKVYLLVSVVKR
ncbi:hypothetical protein FA13DRAFT_1723802 [Coprinellus micaceus]|uniref:DUF6535 domain-containing protein n=1 Tax=Coprinellus micaceus TaxID=71717 RepID=A0A4Y7U1B8_COPMI|nr:hypothetical protein FA13DRAFT_1723802 [Coprinellus micaceus]